MRRRCRSRSPPHGITVNTICPGRIATGRLAKVFGTGTGGAPVDEQQMAEMAKQIPMGRVGTARGDRRTRRLPGSPWAAYITGAVFHVDGGRRASLL